MKKPDLESMFLILKAKQMTRVKDCVQEAVLANEFNGDWREVVRRYKNNAIGVELKIYKSLLLLSESGIETMSRAMAVNMRPVPAMKPVSKNMRIAS
mgnify:CR=1 FL=1